MIQISSISLRDLEYLTALAEHNHFGRAAAHVRVSQPALSAQVKKIEELLGISLFERTQRRVLVTPVGEKIIAQAQVVLEEAKKIIDLLDTQSAPWVGPFRLAAIATLGPYYLPYILGPLQKKFPQMKLSLKEGLTEGLLEDLRMGRVDAVLGSPTSSPSFSDQEFQIFSLFFEPFLLALPKHHPLANQAVLRPQDLSTNEMVLLEDGHCLRDQSIEVCPASRRGETRRFHATSLETLKHLVAVGHGYTLVPRLATDDRKRLADLIEYRAFSDYPNIGRQVALVTRKRYSKMKDMEILANYLIKIKPLV